MPILNRKTILLFFFADAVCMSRKYLLKSFACIRSLDVKEARKKYSSYTHIRANERAIPAHAMH